MRVGRLLLAGVLVGVLMASGPATAALPACTTQAERDAMTVRAFQSYLMVAAVACNQAQAYNSFVSRYQGDLSAHGQRLKGYFQRVYGRGSEPKLNDFITDLANAWSQLHMANMGAYCKATWDTMWYLTKGQQAGPAGFAQAVAERSTSPVVRDLLCAGAAPAAATVAAATPPPPAPAAGATAPVKR